MSTDYGLGSAVDHDLKSSNPPPRYMFMFAERETTPDGAPGDEDPIFGFRSATTITGSDAKFVAGVLSGSLPTPEHNITVSNLSAGIVGETDRITVKPGIVFNPQSAAGPATDGSVYFDSDTGELMLYSGSWSALTTGSGMTAHALNGAYHTGDLDYTQLDSIVNITGSGSSTLISRSDHAHTDADGSPKIAYSNLSGIPSTFTPIVHALGTAGGYHSGTLPLSDLADTVYTDTQTDTAISTAIGTHAGLTGAHHSETHVLATTGPHSGELPLTDLIAGTQGSIIRRGASDWEEYALGSTNNVLKAGATDVAWGTVDWSELTGTQPAPVSHDFDTHSGDVDLTDLASYARGSLIIGGATDWTTLVAGTNTYVLTSDGTDISWQAPPGGSGLGGSGTVGTIAKWVTDTTTLGDSIITESGTTISIAGALALSGALSGVTTIAAGGGGFDVDASGNITDCGTISSGAITASSLKCTAGATISDIDTSMASSPADTQLLTAQAIMEYVKQRKYTIPILWHNGTTHTAAGEVGLLLSKDDYAHGNIIVPYTGTVTIYALVMSTVADTTVDYDCHYYENILPVAPSAWDGSDTAGTWNGTSTYRWNLIALFSSISVTADNLLSVKFISTVSDDTVLGGLFIDYTA